MDRDAGPSTGASRERFRVPGTPPVVALVLTILLLATVVSPAGADTIDELRAQARRAADELERLEARAVELDEQYNLALVELSDARAAMEDASRDVAAADAEIGDKRDQVADAAVAAYVGGDHEIEAFGLDAGDIDTARAYLRSAIDTREDAIDALRMAEEDAERERVRLEELGAEAERLVAEMETARAGVERSIDERESVVAGLEAEVRELVAAEEARRAAEAAAEAERRAAEQAERLAVAAPSPTPAATPEPAASPTAAPVAPVQPTAPAVRGGVAAVLAEAQAQLGVPYRWAGSTPATGFDCSGFTAWAWAAGGVQLPHSSRAQRNATTPITADQLQPGDLVFYGNPINHVGIYAGNGQLIHAPSTGKTVEFKNMYYSSKPMSFGRVG
ncbi:MAG: NlpC/P60 family protein [Actinomycetota bacterium]|nr:NlpC/P60 family protein [Actinomycetota bacterium]